MGKTKIFYGVLCALFFFINNGLALNSQTGLQNEYSVNNNRNRHKREVLFDKVLSDPECTQLKEFCGGLGAYIKEGDTALNLLGCIQSLSSSQVAEITDLCQHTIWTFVSSFMDDVNLKKVASVYCVKDLPKIRCASVIGEPGSVLACLIDNRNIVKAPKCRGFIQKLEYVAFSDLRLISAIVKHCKEDVDKHECGRLDKKRDDTLSQGETLACLQTHIDTLIPECKQEILHVSEMQAENVKLDRQLRLSCTADQLRFCPELSPGSGVIYKCLMLHKSSPSEPKILA